MTTTRFGRAEILAGLANGLFLLFIALFIMKEAIERSFEPPEVHHERLFVISVLGFIVNLVGIFVFQHGGQTHHHGSGGCSHSHSNMHSKYHQHDQHEDHNSHGYSHYSSPTLYDKQHAGAVALDMNGYSAGKADEGTFSNHKHDHCNLNSHKQPEHTTYDTHNIYHASPPHLHDFDSDPLIESTGSRPRSTGRGQIMQSVFLHIVADTLGSIGVMISALLMNQFGLMIADPLCSLFIAILISISVYPLLRDSFYVLMQRVPVDLEDKLPNCLHKIQSLNGVLSVHESHFWTLNSDTYVGCIKLEVAQGADQKFILSNTKTLINQIGVDKVHIQIDQV